MQIPNLFLFSIISHATHNAGEIIFYFEKWSINIHIIFANVRSEMKNGGKI